MRSQVSTVNVATGVSDAVPKEDNSPRVEHSPEQLIGGCLLADGHQPDLPDIHNGRCLFSLGFDRQRVIARFRKVNFAQMPGQKDLKMPGLLNYKGNAFSASFQDDIAAALVLPAALPQFDRVATGFVHVKRPFGPIILVDPIAEAVFVSLRLVSQHRAMRDRITGMQKVIARFIRPNRRIGRGD
jgi:hypothetical protein